MNRFARCLLLILASFLLPSGASQAQVNFFLTEVNILPPNPDSETPISIQLAGMKSNACSYLASSSVTINNNLVSILMNWENSANLPPFPTCPTNVEEPWDSTFSIGVLDAGTYFLILDGTNFFLTGLPNSILFNVSDPSCVEPDGSILVTNTADNGSGSLRQAIQCANEMPGANTIQFVLPGNGPDTIRVGETTQTALPALIDGTTIIDGSTHPGFGNGDFSPKVVLDGQYNNWDSPINALWIQGNDCAVYSLEIINFPDDAIDITGANNVQIGAADRGNVIHSNGSPIDFFPGAPGTGPWNGCGVVIRGNATSCNVQGNYIGANFSGTLSPGNEYCGVLIRDGGDNHTIGGTLAGQGNVIARNASGIRINNGSFYNSIRQNSIYCNDTVAIELLGNANLTINAPLLTAASGSGISGTADPSQTIEVYLNDNTSCDNAPCQGKVLLGTTTVQNGVWTLLPPFANGITLNGGEKITALAHTNLGNSSQFANCLVVVGVSDCTNSQGIVWVSNTNDEGDGSLRAAIDCVNNTPGSNQIHFNIPGTGPHIIQVGSTSGEALPALLDESTILDASTQAGFGDNGNFSPQIILDGQTHLWTVPINALWIRGNFCEVYALEIINFPDDGIDITQADFVTIGAANKGNVIYNNGSDQDFFSGAPGTGPWNGCGIVVKQGASQTIIQGNIIGTNYNRDLVAGNEYCGIIVQNGGDDQWIGGTQAGENNIIAYHHTGIRINANSDACLIQHNVLYCNDSLGIQLVGNANNNQLPPTIDTVDVNIIAGQTAVSDLFVEVFINDNTGCSDAPCQGKTFLGQANVVNGNWQLNTPFANGISLTGGETITAIAIDGNNNSSEYAVCQTLLLCNLTATVGNQTDASCDLANGEFTINTNNGLAPFLYDIGNGQQMSSTFSTLSSGTYNVTVTDANTCTAGVSVTLGGSNSPMLNIVSSTNASCDLPNGSIDVLATGGTAPYDYLLVGATTDGPPFMGLIGGTYTIMVTDANGCTANVTSSITTSPATNLSVTNIIDATCNQANGSVSLSASAGTPPYLYYLDGQSSNNSVFNNLSGGTYSVSVEDTNGCIATESITIGDSPIPTLTISNNTAATCDQADGTFTVSASNGTAPYLYHFGQISTGIPVFTGLSGGSYSVSVEDANGCMDSQMVTIGNTPAPLIAVNNVTSATCGDANGSITVSAVLGTPPYQYDLGNGLTNSPVFNNLVGGIYNVSVVDANECTASLTAIIGTSPAPVLELLTTTNPTCGLGNGSATYAGSGGTAPYTYSIGSATFLNPVFTGISAGIYEVTITDFLGCTAVESFELTDPGAPQPTIDELSNASCGLNNGSVIIGAFDGLTPYTFDIGNGPVSNSTFIGLAANLYVVTITDNLGCSNTIEVNITNVGDPTNAAFTFQDNLGLVDFMNMSVNADSYSWDFGDGTTSTDEHPSHEFLLDGDYTVCLTSTNACGDDLSCSLISIIVPLAEVSISGSIATFDGLPVNLVTVNCTDESPVTTTSDGFYEFLSLPAAEDFTVTPVKDINYQNGVNIFDIYLIQQHILSVIPLDTPYKRIAADVNDNGIINLIDILRIQQLILDITDTFPDNTSWRFIPSNFVFTNPLDPFTLGFPESLTFPNLVGDSINQDFVGVKVGDVSGNADPQLSPSRTVDLRMENRTGTIDEIIQVELRAHDFSELSALQMNLHFDAEKLEWEGVELANLEGLTTDHFALSEHGNLRMIWHDQTLQNDGITLEESSILFRLEFRVLQDFDDLSEQIQITDLLNFSSQAFDPTGEKVNLNLIFENTLLSADDLKDDFAVTVFPNPFSDRTNLQVDLTGTKVVELNIYDALGRLVKTKTQSITNHGILEVNGNELNGTGIYFWELKAEKIVQRGKLFFKQ